MKPGFSKVAAEEIKSQLPYDVQGTTQHGRGNF